MPLRAYKTEIAVNNKQNALLLQHLGCARWAFNWALNQKKKAFEEKTKLPNTIELHKELNQLKKTEFPWFYQSSKSSPQNALRNCDKAFANFFTRCKKKVKGKKGFPKFKSKKNKKQFFRLDGAISVEPNAINLPRIGKIRLKKSDYLPIDQKILSATISKQADRWFVSLQVESPKLNSPTPTVDVLGVDLGIKTLATCSDGTTFEKPKPLKKRLKTLKRKSRQLSKTKKGSKNREKAKRNLAILHYKISNIRRDCLHKITSSIVQKTNVLPKIHGSSGKRRFEEKTLYKGQTLFVCGDAMLSANQASAKIRFGEDKFLQASIHGEEKLSRYIKIQTVALGILPTIAGISLLPAINSFHNLNLPTALSYTIGTISVSCLLLLILTLCLYNGLIDIKNRVKKANANVDVQLKKRKDLIPLLEKILKASKSHEKQTLEEISQLRSQFKDQNNSPIAIWENHSNLHTNNSFQKFSKTLTEIEGKIALSKEFHIRSIYLYNTTLSQFPINSLAKILNFKKIPIPQY